MKIEGKIEGRAAKTVSEYVKRRGGDCEPLVGRKTWYGREICCEPLFASYGQIGYRIFYGCENFTVDCELGVFRVG